MSYEQVDSVLYRWATSNGLTVSTLYKDYEVRSIDVVDAQGARFQLWLDPPEATGEIGVHVWDYRRRRADYEVQLKDLTECLDDALRMASKWSSSGGAQGSSARDRGVEHPTD